MRIRSLIYLDSVASPTKNVLRAEIRTGPINKVLSCIIVHTLFAQAIYCHLVALTTKI